MNCQNSCQKAGYFLKVPGFSLCIVKSLEGSQSARASKTLLLWKKSLTVLQRPHKRQVWEELLCLLNNTSKSPLSSSGARENPFHKPECAASLDDVSRSAFHFGPNLKTPLALCALCAFAVDFLYPAICPFLPSLRLSHFTSAVKLKGS